MELFFLEAGEGEAVYIDKGGVHILIDAGDLIGGFRVARFLGRRGVRVLDLFLTTHAHLDHIGGVFHIVPRFRCSIKGDNGERLSVKREVYRWYIKAFRGKRYVKLKRGDFFRFGRLKVEVIWPVGGAPTRNDSSLVLRLSYGRAKVLLMGDATSFVEKELLRMGEDLKADVLKVGHHGAWDSSSSEFLDAVSPDYAVICACKDHFHGYPSSEVLERLNKRGVKVFHTAKSGSVSFKLNFFRGIVGVKTFHY